MVKVEWDKAHTLEEQVMDVAKASDWGLANFTGWNTGWQEYTFTV